MRKVSPICGEMTAASEVYLLDKDAEAGLQVTPIGLFPCRGMLNSCRCPALANGSVNASTAAAHLCPGIGPVPLHVVGER